VSRSAFAVAVVATVLHSIGLVCAESTTDSDRPDFAALDHNNDKRLSQSEYVELDSANSKLLIRDFRLFDGNGDGYLSPSDFASMLPGDKGTRRGPMEDPWERILDRAIEAMDESYDGWHHRKDETVDSTTFSINYIASISTDGRRRLDRGLLLQADPNQDRKVSRDEAKRFLELQLGIRWIPGDRLRKPSGCVVDVVEFLRLDSNQDNQISREEFIDQWWNGSDGQAVFQQLDDDRNDALTLGEYGDPRGPNLHDPIELFRRADTNLDALLDVAELNAAVPRQRGYLIKSNLSGFDADGDEKLSLSEYRLSMLANFNEPWQIVPKDDDRDQSLSFEEFKFGSRNPFGLQRRYYFHKLDTDGDNLLSDSEFEFQRHKLYSLYRISVDGEDAREIYRNQDFPICSSPAVSPDGEWILFDATPPEGSNRTQIVLMTSEGQDARDLSDGLMPTWSKDGTQFACSRYEGGSGVWIMNLDGTPHKRIDDGWAAQWSPDGRTIAYTNDNSVRVYDVESGQTRIVLPKGSTPYRYVYWNMAYSPDSKRLVFKGKLALGHEIAIVNVAGEPELRRRFRSNEEMGSDFGWAPDGRRILFNMHSRQHGKSLIFQIDPDGVDPPKIVPEAMTTLPWQSICFSPDGNWMVLATPN
jgi:TolB protein